MTEILIDKSSKKLSKIYRANERLVFISKDWMIADSLSGIIVPGLPAQQMTLIRREIFKYRFAS